MPAKYQAYSEYKDSGVEWLNEIPKHWSMSKLRYIGSFGKGLSITKENLSDVGIPCVNYGEVHSKYGFEVDAETHPLKCVDKKYLQTSPNALLSKGDLVFADTSEDIEGSGNFTQLVGNLPVFAGYHTVVVRPDEGGFARFLAYVLDSLEYRTQVRTAVKGVKVFSITQAILRNTNVWLPSFSEQKQIAKFLDHETAKVDTLIEKQQQLIKLLKEKRQAVISHAVTKDLNPNAPMKDSCVEWLGDVPAHWEVSKLGFYAIKIGSGKTPRGGADIYQDAGVLFLRSQNIYDEGLRISKNEAVFISNDIHEEMKGTKVLGGDVLLNITGGSIGRTCLVPKDFVGANVNQHVCILRFNSDFNEFFSYVLKSHLIKEQIDSCQTGGNREGMNFDQISGLIVCIPPKNERLEIIESIKSAIKRFDKLESKSNNAIRLIKERRTALISAAVTGKIDVRSHNKS